MDKILKIVGLVFRIVAIILMISVSIVSLGTAYIVFAPDDFPKPFYLVYAYPGDLKQPIVPSGAVGTEGSSTSGENTSGTTEETTTAEEGYMLNTGAKIINLAEPGGRRYIRVTVVLEYVIPPDVAAANAKAAEAGGEGATVAEEMTAFEEEVTTMQPVVDDTIITLLSSKTYDQIYTSEGKEILRAELLEAINTKLEGKLEVKNVYFSEFVLQ